MQGESTPRTSLTPEEQTRSQSTRVHFHSVPYHRATALERPSKRGAFTLSLEEDRTLEPCQLTVLRSAPLLIWTDEEKDAYLLLMGRFTKGEVALKVYIKPLLMADLYRAVHQRREYSPLELLSLSLEDGRTTLTLKRGPGPAFPYTLEPDEALQVGLGQSSAGLVSAFCQVDVLSSGGRVRCRVLRAISEDEAVLEQVRAYQGYGPNPTGPRSGA